MIHVRPNYRVSKLPGSGKGKTNVCLIGDIHDSPGLRKDRFRWIGKHVRKTKPDLVVQIGDMSSIDSLCSYDKNDSLKGKRKPSFRRDMDSLKEALDAFDDGLGSFNVGRHVTLGNHEDRIWSFTDRTPEAEGILAALFYETLDDANWSYSPYGAIHYIGGVGFTHVPLNGLGKPYGGMHSENQIARDALSDLIYGHTHKRVEKTYPKLGGRKTTILNPGCALPHGHIEAYAKHANTGWSWGIYDLTIDRGAIAETHWIPMSEVKCKYA